MMRKVRLITYVENGRELVSHGVCEETLGVVVLPPQSVASFEPEKDSEGFYISLPE